MSIPTEVFRRVQPMVKEFEGFFDHQYDDGTGVKTIGYGFIASDFAPHPMPAHMTEHEADQYLTKKLNETYYPPVAALNKQLGNAMNPNMLASLTSFVFNLGTGEIGPTHTIGHFLRQKDWRAAANSMLLYSDPNDPVVHAGLLRRREAEKKLFLTKYTPPNPYLVYPNETFGPHHINERKTAQAIDAALKHPVIHHHALVTLLPAANYLKTRIWVVSVFEPPWHQPLVKRKHADWSDKRGSRYQLWAHRIDRVKKALG